MSETVSNDIAMPFSAKKQDAVLGYLITDEQFLVLARHQISPDWFIDPHNQKIWSAILAFMKAYDRRPTLDELQESSDLKYEEQIVKNKLKAKINACVEETNAFKLDVLRKELTHWQKARIFFQGAKEAERVWENARREEQLIKAYDITENTVKKLKNASFEQEYEVSFGDPQKDIDDTLIAYANALTFGSTVVDKIMVPENNGGGGLLLGDTTVIIAPYNIGKTTTMITAAVANIMRGRHVAFIFHEGNERDLKLKFWCNALGITKAELFTINSTEEGRKRTAYISQFFERFLTFIPLVKAGLTIEEVEPIIRRKQDEIASKNNGVGIQLLVDDYPARLHTRQASHGNLQKRHIDEIIYGYFSAFGNEYNWHNILAIQTNREGSKINKGLKEEHRLLRGEDVHESIGPIQEAVNVITLNRSNEDKIRRRMTFFIDKSRSSETEIAVVARTDFAKAITHSDELGAIWYRGTDSRADRVEALLTDKEKWGTELADI